MPRLGECANCKKAPVRVFRYNIVVVEKTRERTFTMLTCQECAETMVGMLNGMSVEKTPTDQLDLAF